MIGDPLRAFPPSGSSVDDVETAFTTAILQTTERVAPPRATRLPGREWRGDAQAKAEISMATAARRAAWKLQRADTQDSQLMRADSQVSQLMRAVRRKNTRVTGSAPMLAKKSLKDTSRVWRRICASATRGGSTSAAILEHGGHAEG